MYRTGTHQGRDAGVVEQRLAPNCERELIWVKTETPLTKAAASRSAHLQM
jgi:hypothetical protein